MILGASPAPCVSSRLQLCVQNCDHLPPPTHTFLKRRFLTDFEKHTHTPPKVTTFWCIRPKVEKNLKKCENAPRWQETDVPERNQISYNEVSNINDPKNGYMALVPTLDRTTSLRGDLRDVISRAMLHARNPKHTPCTPGSLHPREKQHTDVR